MIAKDVCGEGFTLMMEEQSDAATDSLIDDHMTRKDMIGILMEKMANVNVLFFSPSCFASSVLHVCPLRAGPAHCLCLVVVVS